MAFKDKFKEAERGRCRWAARDAEGYKAYRRSIYQRNPEAQAERSRNWIKNNPEAAFVCSRSSTAKRRAVVMDLLHPEMDYEAEAKLLVECYELVMKTGESHHIDHIISMSLGGWHHHLNLQILPQHLNVTKKENPLWHHQGYKSWVDVPEFLWPPDLREAYTILYPTYKERYGIT